MSSTSSNVGSPQQPQHQSTLFPIPDQLSLTNNQLFRLIYWVDPLTSGLVLGCVLLFCLLTTVQDFSAITLLSYLIVLQIVICFIYVNSVQAWYRFQGQELPSDQFYSQIEPLRENATRERILELLRPTAEAMNSLITYSINIMRCVDNVWTVTVAICFFALGWVAKHFSSHAILAILSILLFTVPLMYSKKQKVIDDFITKVASSISKALQSIPLLSKPEKRAPEENFLSSSSSKNTLPANTSTLKKIQ